MSATAIDRLKQHDLTVLVEDRNGTLLLASSRPGLGALRQIMKNRQDLLDGAEVALPEVGLAAAYLLLLSKVGRVYARTMTYEARRALDEVGIEHVVSTYARKFTGIPALEELELRAREAVTPQAFWEELRRRID